VYIAPVTWDVELINVAFWKELYLMYITSALTSKIRNKKNALYLVIKTRRLRIAYWRYEIRDLRYEIYALLVSNLTSQIS